MNRPSRTLVVAALTVAVAGILSGVAIGAGVASTTNTGGTSVERVNVVRSTDVFHTGSTAFTNVAGATSKITVPAGHRAVLVARFTAQEDCNVGDGSPTGSCMLRILLGEHEMQPASAGQIVDSVQAGRAAGIRSAALDRSTAVLGPGTYTVRVQGRVTNALMVFEMTDWHLTVERVDV